MCQARSIGGGGGTVHRSKHFPYIYIQKVNYYGVLPPPTPFFVKIFPMDLPLPLPFKKKMLRDCVRKSNRYIVDI